MHSNTMITPDQETDSPFGEQRPIVNRFPTQWMETLVNEQIPQSLNRDHIVNKQIPKPVNRDP